MDESRLFRVPAAGRTQASEGWPSASHGESLEAVVAAEELRAVQASVITAIVGWFFMPETKDRNIWEEVGGHVEQSRMGVGTAEVPAVP
jgi:hypothetical protein